MVAAAGLGALTTRVLADAAWTDRALAMALVLEATRVPHRLVIDGWVEVVAPRRQGSSPSPALFVLSFVGLAVVRLMLCSALLVAAVAVMRSTPWWPLALWALGMGAMGLVGAAYPLVLASLVDRAVPLSNPALRAELEALAQRAGVALPRVLVAANPSLGEGAYVAGIGRSRALVMGAQLALGPQSLRRAVLAHELGHCKLRHQRASLVGWAASAAALVGVLWLLSTVEAASAVGAVDLVDPRALPLWLVAGGAVGLASRVLLAALSRAHERAADGFAVALLGERRTLLDHLRRHLVASGGELDPHGLRRLVATHPQPAERLDFLGAPARTRAHADQARTMSL